MTKSRGLIAKRGTRAAFIAANEGQHACACGCGETISIRKEHFSEGIPKYRHGHNPQPRAAKPPRSLCACGCGELANYGKRFVTGHNTRGRRLPEETKQRISTAMSGTSNHRHGTVPHNFKGRTMTGNGYFYVHSPTHPFRSQKRLVMEHRLVMEAHLRSIDPGSSFLTEVAGELYLRPEIDVHHRDHDKTNNVVENLQCLTKAEHSRLHQAERR